MSNVTETIKAAQRFEKKSMERDERDKKVGFFIGAVGVLIAILSIVVIIILLPLKETKVSLYILDKAAGTITKVSEFTEESISGDLATNKVNAENYIELRERYNYFSLQDDYNRVQAFNSDDVNKEYLSVFNGKNSPDIIYHSADNTVRIKIISDFITEATKPDLLATIRFKKTIRNIKSGIERDEFWVARFTFRYVPTKDLTEEQRDINKLGFVVTSYEVEKENGVTP